MAQQQPEDAWAVVEEDPTGGITIQGLLPPSREHRLEERALWREKGAALRHHDLAADVDLNDFFRRTLSISEGGHFTLLLLKHHFYLFCAVLEFLRSILDALHKLAGAAG
eukprot:CAMPEP_0179133004 /NCGR_PEP_ID=MMETSP0796-20121207/63235_1 /TAXON_ID=73915 /ORGANISM="Pyrodinium bahamense, Strain pbaha01" /LENGTH=109 /DNA_ID=CAMNT_0020831959 /DNA_START=194 /DNA_END=520 /DNA_ORIENTATION=-